MHRRYFKSEFDQWGVELSMSTRHYKSTVLCCAFSFPFLSVTRQTYQRTVPPLVMRSLKCVSFLLWMVILLATIGSFRTTAHRELLMATRGVETKLELTVEKTNIEEEIRNNVPTVRKMDFGTADANDARSIPSSGAKHSAGKCGHGGRKDLSMNCYFRSRKLHPGTYFDGHIPFTADYRQPRNHPPKNN